MTSKYKISAICILLIMTILSSFLILPVNAATEAEAKALAKIDPVLLEKMETASPDEKIPVAIWYTDIDQEKVDKLTVDKVGYTQDDIALTYEMPSTELINNLEKGEEGAVSEMQAYLKRTEKIRENERKRTNEYIMTRREFSRVKYNEKSAKIIKDISLEEKDITFKSQYAPMVILNLTVSQIDKIKSITSIEGLYYYEEVESTPMSIETALEVSGVNRVNIGSNLGLTGNEVKIGIIENHSVLVSMIEQDARHIVPDVTPADIRTSANGTKMTDYGNVVIVGNTSYSPNYTHANAVADTLLSVSPNIKLYSCNNSLNNVEAMISDGVQIISCSVGTCPLETNGYYLYTINEKWYDHIISNHSVAMIVAAGNTGHRKWVLEDINYQNGDVNMDGDIDVTDATLISKWLGHTIVLSNAQNLLADANYDGTISIQDATYIRKLIANQT